jgi:hypothetical protein
MARAAAKAAQIADSETVAPAAIDDAMPTSEAPLPPRPGRPSVSVDEAAPDATTGPAYPQTRRGVSHTGKPSPQPPGQPKARASVQQAEESTSKPTGEENPQASAPGGEENPATDTPTGPEEDSELAQLLRASIKNPGKGPTARPDLGSSAKLVKLQTMLAQSKAENVGGFTGANYRAELRKAIDAVKSGDTSLANLILNRR